MSLERPDPPTRSTGSTASTRWQKSSYLWPTLLAPLSILAFAAALAPRIEMYTQMACLAHRPAGVLTGTTLGQVGGGNGMVGCAQDPEVVKAAAKIIAVVTTTTGILNAMCAGFWGSWSDRHGRSLTMAIAAVGAFSSDFGLLLISRFAPTHYWLLLVGAVIEGSLGGTASVASVGMAYIADVTMPSERSSKFSRITGLTHLGVAIGPTAASLLVRSTGNVNLVFVFSCTMQLAVALLALLVMPESTTSAGRLRASEASEAIVHDAKPLTRLVYFLSPLAIFAPKRSKNGKGRDWNLFLIGFSLSATYLFGGATPYRIQYIEAAFNWSLETVGYAVTIVSLVRTTVLLVLLPLGYNYCASRRKEFNASTSLQLDLSLTRIFLFSELICYTATAVLPSAVAFSTASLVGTLGSGFIPTSLGLAVELYRRSGGTEDGKLFGATAVAEALFSQMIAPIFFGLIWNKTLVVFPRAILCVGSVAFAFGFGALMLVRLPEEKLGDLEDDVDQLPGDSEETPLLRGSS